MTRWQHKTPQEEPGECYPIKPSYAADQPDYVWLCRTCGKPIYQVDEDEGPESLKALLRL